MSAPVPALIRAIAKLLENPTAILLESLGLYATDDMLVILKVAEVKYLSHFVLG